MKIYGKDMYKIGIWNLITLLHLTLNEEQEVKENVEEEREKLKEKEERKQRNRNLVGAEKKELRGVEKDKYIINSLLIIYVWRTKGW